MITGIKGMNDAWPDQLPYWQLIEQQAHEIFGRCGFGEVRTPILESIELFQRSVGETTDIVQKEMFTLEDRKGRKMAMRPEGTAAVVRALIEHGRDGLNETQKYYYMGPMFRYERPQKGRLRQFHQLGAEVFGSLEPIADADLLETLALYFEALGLKGIEMQINSLGDAQCRPAFRQALQLFLQKHQAALCVDCQKRISQNPLRVLDCKVETCAQIVATAPLITDYLCQPCRQHLDATQRLLARRGRTFVMNPRMARGLDYYNRTVFEILAEGIGAKSAICGGGRYDELVAHLGGKPTPAIGFAMGIERVILLLQQQPPIAAPGPDVWVAYMGESLREPAFDLVCQLRRDGVATLFDYSVRSLKNQFARAAKLGAKYVVIFGEEEQKAGEVTLKNLANGQQSRCSQAGLLAQLKADKGR